MKINLFLTNKKCNAKLMLVKSIKTFSEPTMGLKEAKWLVDDLFDNIGICSFNIKNGTFNEYKEFLRDINIGIKSSREEKLKRILDPREEKNIKKNKNTLHFIYDELKIKEDDTDKDVYIFEDNFSHFIEKYLYEDSLDWNYNALDIMSNSFLSLLKVFKPFMEKNNITIDEFIRTINRQLRQ